MQPFEVEGASRHTERTDFQALLHRQQVLQQGAGIVADPGAVCGKGAYIVSESHSHRDLYRFWNEGFQRVFPS
ncbi:MAG: hypothetical protein AMXMBFR84_24000 [Candidatus Hydrogenedentota bacterium]